jgi:hypothetical protein
MDTSARCPRCGSPLPAAGPAHNCPVCGPAGPSVLSGPLVPRDEAGPPAHKPRSWGREGLLYFAVFIPLVLLAGGIVYLIISWVQSARR